MIIDKEEVHKLISDKALIAKELIIAGPIYHIILQIVMDQDEFGSV